MAVESSNNLCVQELLTCKDINIHIKNKQHRTPLHTAELLLLLSSNERYSEYKQKYESIVSLLHTFAVSDHQMQSDSTTLNPVSPTDYPEETPFSPRRTLIHQTVTNQDYEALALILKHNLINVNARDAHLRTPLEVAVTIDNVDFIKLLLSVKDINVNAQDYYEYTPLYTAVLLRHYEHTKLLLAHPDVNVNILNKDYETPLYRAASYYHSPMVKLLLAHKDINLALTCKNDYTPLHCAAATGLVDTLKDILEKNEYDVNS